MEVEQINCPKYRQYINLHESYGKGAVNMKYNIWREENHGVTDEAKARHMTTQAEQTSQQTDTLDSFRAVHCII